MARVSISSKGGVEWTRDVASDGVVKSPLAETERFNLILGITCHAIYHAGQVQLIKRLHAG